MRSFWFTLVFAAFIALALPLAAGALGLDVEVNAGAGLGLGSTNNPNETGSPRFALQGGLEADLYLLSVGPVDLGISTGLEYSNFTVHATLTEPYFPPPATVNVDSDNNFVYLIIPFVITSRIPLSSSLNLSLRAGGFLGHFMGGQATNITSSQPLGLSSTSTLDSSTTIVGAWGLHFSGGVDIGLGGGLYLSPSAIFNMGLTNTTASSGYAYTDALWSLTAMIGLKYNVF